MAQGTDWSAMTDRWTWRGSVRSKLTAVAAALVAVTLVVVSVGLLSVQRNALTDGIDEALRQRADNIEPSLRAGLVGQDLPTEGDPQDSFLQLLGPTGRVSASSANVRGLGPVVRPGAGGPDQKIRTIANTGPGPDTFRVLSRSVESGGRTQTLIVAKNLDDVHESVAVLARSLRLAIPIAIVLLGAMVWWLTGRVLRPVELIRSEVASMHGNELDRRVPVPRSTDEIARLAATMNAMLDRVERASGQQQRFVADASHELRGPLTRLRTDLEVSIAHPATADPADTYQVLLGDALELEQLFEDLLLLARSDATATEKEKVDLDDLVLEEAQRVRARGAVRVETSGVSAARVLGDGQQLARAIRNLADNAERHARSVVSFELREREDTSELIVADDGPGIPVESQAMVFQRFTRLDEARSRGAGGSGLGLAIVADIVFRHGGKVMVVSGPGEGARLRITLPRAD